MPPRKLRSQGGASAPSRCRICDKPLNSYNRTGICLHGHNGAGISEQTEEDTWKPRYKTPAPAVLPETVPLSPSIALPQVAVMTGEESAYVESLIQAACTVYEVSGESLRDKTLRDAPLMETRQVIMYIACMEALGPAKIASVLNRHPSGASQAFGHIRFRIKGDTGLADRIRRIMEMRTPLLCPPTPNSPPT